MYLATLLLFAPVASHTCSFGNSIRHHLRPCIFISNAYCLGNNFQPFINLLFGNTKWRSNKK